MKKKRKDPENSENRPKQPKKRTPTFLLELPVVEQRQAARLRSKRQKTALAAASSVRLQKVI